jgi:UDP-2,4-diacetamido-2,4,6-trideoxy-beta-L-altropyranose hydrolase
VNAAFRCEANGTIGFGHLMRCLTLAEAIARHRVSSVFLLSTASAAAARTVADQGHTAVILNAKARDAAGDAAETLRHVTADTRLIVVDDYHVGARWHEAVRRDGLAILAIDDLADRPMAPDILLDHNASASAARYRDRLERPATLLLGPEYALIRADCEAMRRAPRLSHGVARILVSFGGTAPGVLYRKAIAALASTSIRPLHLTAIGIEQEGDRADIKALARDGVDIDVHGFAPDLARHVAAADLVIGAGGVSALERALIGVPALVYTTAANQSLPAHALAEAGAIMAMGDAQTLDARQLVDTVEGLHYTPGALHAMAAAGQRIVPGGGPARVARAVLTALE